MCAQPCCEMLYKLRLRQVWSILLVGHSLVHSLVEKIFLCVMWFNAIMESLGLFHTFDYAQGSVCLYHYLGWCSGPLIFVILLFTNSSSFWCF